MTNKGKTQWHPAFCAAMRLELKEDAKYLDYTNEYNLNSKPLEIDLLIVKKSKNIEVKNEIGKIFRKHNIIEYKSPDDSMNVNTYLKVNAYACLYKTFEERVDEIELDEITLTMVRENKPHKLFQWFREHGYKITRKHQGIYYIQKDNTFPLQILISRELSKKNQKWLTLLNRDINKKDAKRVVKQIDNLGDVAEKQLGDSVLQVVMRENKSLFYEIKEDGTMCEALRELMAPEIEEEMRKARELGMQQGIQQGIQQTQKEMIKNALAIGSDANEVSRVMGIPLNKIIEIQNEMQQKTDED